MTLKATVARVDDYSGELAQSLEKLEIERSRGTLNRNEQLDFIHDLRSAIEKTDLQPMKSKFTLAFLIGLALVAGSKLMARFLPQHKLYALVMIVIGLLALSCSAYWFWIFARRQKRETQWLNALETCVSKGGTVFDQV